MQEAITGRGVITTFTEASEIGEVMGPLLIAATFGVSVLGLTAIIAASDDDTYFSPEAVIRELDEL